MVIVLFSMGLTQFVWSKRTLKVWSTWHKLLYSLGRKHKKPCSLTLLHLPLFSYMSHQSFKQSIFQKDKKWKKNSFSLFFYISFKILKRKKIIRKKIIPFLKTMHHYIFPFNQNKNLINKQSLFFSHASDFTSFKLKTKIPKKLFL